MKPYVTNEQLAQLTGDFIIGDDGDVEELCEHGVGHSNEVHTCDGCCTNQYEEIALGKKPKKQRIVSKYKPSRRGKG